MCISSSGYICKQPCKQYEGPRVRATTAIKDLQRLFSFNCKDNRLHIPSPDSKGHMISRRWIYMRSSVIGYAYLVECLDLWGQSTVYTEHLLINDLQNRSNIIGTHHINTKVIRIINRN